VTAPLPARKPLRPVQGYPGVLQRGGSFGPLSNRGLEICFRLLYPILGLALIVTQLGFVLSNL